MTDGRLLAEFLKQNLRKRDLFVLLFYYILTVIYFFLKDGNDDFIVLPTWAFFIMGVTSLIMALCISGLVDVGFWIYSLFLSKEKRKEFDQKFSDEWLDLFAIKIWLFLLGVVVSILSFSFIPKIFRIFKEKGGLFGGGGASGKI